MAGVGGGAEVGLHPVSAWNNPEPEVVLAIAADGRIVGGTLGNDVNLRDVEGRSALLLGKAKDNNGSAALGPLIRLFDDYFDLDDLRTAELDLRSEEHTSELQSLMRISYAVFCLKKKNNTHKTAHLHHRHRYLPRTKSH